MKVYIVNRYIWFARDKYEIDSIWESDEKAIKRSAELAHIFRDIEEKEVSE